MSDIKALGVHSYFGGFAKGIARNANIRMLGSMESWAPAVRWAPRIGINVITNGVAPRANYVFGNPPCSRFSHMTFSKFSDESRERLDQFEDMEDVLHTAKYAGAELVHIENGPLAFTHGDNLINQFNDILEWPDIYFLVLKICTRHAGLPQIRPRTHIFVGKHPFPEVDLTPVPLPNNIGEFMRNWNGAYNFEAVPSSLIPDPIVYSLTQKYTAVFLSTRPKIVSELDAAAYSVVSSRCFVWAEEKRWWSVDEYAAIQGYDADGFDYAEPGVSHAMALISKSVSPTITQYLTERIVVPYFDVGERSPHRAIKVDLT